MLGRLAGGYALGGCRSIVSEVESRAREAGGREALVEVS